MAHFCDTRNVFVRSQKLSNHVSLVTFSSLVRLLLQAQDLMPMEEGRPSRVRDGLARSFVHGSTQSLLKKERVEASG